MKKTRRIKRAASGSITKSYSEKDLSPIVKFGIVFFMVAVLGVMVFVGKNYF